MKEKFNSVYYVRSMEKLRRRRFISVGIFMIAFLILSVVAIYSLVAPTLITIDYPHSTVCGDGQAILYIRVGIFQRRMLPVFPNPIIQEAQIAKWKSNPDKFTVKEIKDAGQ